MFIIYNFITLVSISTATTITEYCGIAYASNMFIWTKFITPYQNFVLPLMLLNFVGCKAYILPIYTLYLKVI